jgi:hypothetical protein
MLRGVKTEAAFIAAMAAPEDNTPGVSFVDWAEQNGRVE